MGLQNGQRFPGPTSGGGIVHLLPQDQAGATPAAPSPTPVVVQFTFPTPPIPILSVVIQDLALRSTAPIVSNAFPWPHQGALGVQFRNNLDVPVRVDVHINNANNTGALLPQPVLTMFVGPGEFRQESLTPPNDPWAPWVFMVVTPQAVPTQGVAHGEFMRLGDL